MVMIMSRANAMIGAFIVGCLLVLAIGFKFFSMSSEIDELSDNLKAKQVELDKTARNLVQANANVEFLADNNDLIVKEFAKRESAIVEEFTRSKETAAIIQKNEVAKLERDKVISKAKSRIERIAKKKPYLLEKALNTSNAKMFADIESLTDFGA